MADPGANTGRTLSREDADYESARRDSLWRENTPGRFPDRIVQAHSAMTSSGRSGRRRSGISGLPDPVGVCPWRSGGRPSTAVAPTA